MIDKLHRSETRGVADYQVRLFIALIIASPIIVSAGRATYSSFSHSDDAGTGNKLHRSETRGVADYQVRLFIALIIASPIIVSAGRATYSSFSHSDDAGTVNRVPDIYKIFNLIKGNASYVRELKNYMSKNCEIEEKRLKI
ncbi:hypothetical protein Glove_19g266 [Diversispora epigaea]|uniref:Uncharacterized protein n=1 Tax=Diversispora epigaea TaxID=1348612 RepID=A0A397JSF4_9GLOM|nr:hypothetical protein Glove_19g266 [Diversispora epigaea]